jgi:poly(3-hydroxybutyrate) depolymerase
VACTDVVAVGLSAGGGLAALLAFHHAEAFAAVVAVAAPPLLGRVNLQDPRQVMRQGLAASPTLAALGLAHCAPLLVLHGADDEVVTPRCAEQLAEQARGVHERAHGPLQEQAGDDGITWLRDGRPVVQRRLLPGLAHAWSGGPGGHAHVLRDGPPLVRLALAFVRQH